MWSWRTAPPSCCSCLLYTSKLDAEANKNVKDEGIVSTADSKVKIMVISTNEELAIARDTLALTSK